VGERLEREVDVIEELEFGKRKREEVLDPCRRHAGSAVLIFLIHYQENYTPTPSKNDNTLNTIRRNRWIVKKEYSMILCIIVMKPLSNNLRQYVESGHFLKFDILMHSNYLFKQPN
jgi:hypothetical protein